MVCCDVCYDEVEKKDLFGLSCQHLFCKLCLQDHLERNINDGLVTSIPCMQLGCEEKFEDDDVARFGNEELNKKY